MTRPVATTTEATTMTVQGRLFVTKRPTTSSRGERTRTRFDVTCGRCHLRILSGEIVLFEPGHQPIHDTPEACRNAAEFWSRPPAERPIALATPQGRWAAFEQTGLSLESHAYRFAKTMPKNPHWYTLRREWSSDPEFVYAAETIRWLGYSQRYGAADYTVLDVNEWFYWSMGYPMFKPGYPDQPCTELINRKPTDQKPQYVLPPYDAIAAQYATMFQDAESLRENERVFELIGDLSDADILDIGCGQGLALDYVSAYRSYTGIDPSARMLDHLRQRHPDANVVRTPLASFVPLRDGTVSRYDALLALFGVGSYLTRTELERLPLLLRPGGRAYVMFIRPGAFPYTHAATGLNLLYYPWRPDMLPTAEVHEVGTNIVAVLRT